jgi:hypothetical protein
MVVGLCGVQDREQGRRPAESGISTGCLAGMWMNSGRPRNAPSARMIGARSRSTEDPAWPPAWRVPSPPAWRTVGQTGRRPGDPPAAALMHSTIRDQNRPLLAGPDWPSPAPVASSPALLTVRSSSPAARSSSGGRPTERHTCPRTRSRSRGRQRLPVRPRLGRVRANEENLRELPGGFGASNVGMVGSAYRGAELHMSVARTSDMLRGRLAGTSVSLGQDRLRKEKLENRVRRLRAHEARVVASRIDVPHSILRQLGPHP